MFLVLFICIYVLELPLAVLDREAWRAAVHGVATKQLDCTDAVVLSPFGRVRLCDLIDCSPPRLLLPGILQARILRWVVMPSPW